MSVTLTLVDTVTAVETLPNNTASSSSANRVVTHDQFNTASTTLTAATTPPVTTPAYFEATMSAGAATIDLTSLTGTNGATYNFTGLKVQVAKFINKSTNANDITIAKGASNGYALAGSAFSVTLSPGEFVTIYRKDTAPDVAAGAKTLDISGTGAQVLQVALIAG